MQVISFVPLVDFGLSRVLVLEYVISFIGEAPVLEVLAVREALGFSITPYILFLLLVWLFV
jgi:hypothetical protein